jgi:biotin transport system substrate-specific component
MQGGSPVSTLVEAIVPARNRALARMLYMTGLAVMGSLLVAGLAQLSITLPFTPVPITGQTLGVLLVGASMGPGLGAATLGLYLAEGAVGLPFFAEGRSGLDILRLSSATGGYLWGFVLAALLVGWLSRRGWDRSIRSSIGAMFIGEIVVYAVGVPWLMAALGVGLEQGLELGLYPFVIGDTLKLLLAAALLPGAWLVVGKARPESRRNLPEPGAPV